MSFKVTDQNHASPKPRRMHALLLFYNRRHHPLIVRWLTERLGCRVTAAIVSLGEPIDVPAVERESLQAGADRTVVLDGRVHFATCYLTRAIKANGVYEHDYYLSAALARPCLAELLAHLANDVGADCIVHGFRGNDQVRLDAALEALSDRTVIAALRHWDVTERAVAAYAREHGLPSPPGTNNPYSVSENIWGKSVECGPLEDPGREPPEEVFALLSPHGPGGGGALDVTILFEAGRPSALDGNRMPLDSLIGRLNTTGATRGVGVRELVEDGTVGVKSRAVYASPAAEVLIAAHRDLERFVCDRHENRFKQLVDHQWAQLVYEGLWFDPLMRHVEAFIDSANARVTGEVTVRLCQGRAWVTCRSSPHSIYDAGQAIYHFGDGSHRDDVAGFGRIHNLHTRLAFRKRREVHGDGH